MTTPTQAQIGALKFYADRANYMEVRGPAGLHSYQIRPAEVMSDGGQRAEAALAAAEQVGEQPIDIWNAGWRAGEASTIERCAQVADEILAHWEKEIPPDVNSKLVIRLLKAVAAAIRKMKDE